VSALFNSSRLHEVVGLITGYPWTVGCWFNITTLGGTRRDIVTCTTSSSTSNAISIYTDTASHLITETDPEATVGDLGAVSTGVWYYVIYRGISSTNRRSCVLVGSGSSAGATTHVQTTGSATASGMDRTSIGGSISSGVDRSSMIGVIAELFITNKDIQADGAQLSDGTLRQLAYSGPFSVPAAMNGLVEYRGFRNSLEFEAGDDVLWGYNGKTVLTKTNTVTLGPHPPLIEPYQRVRRSQIIVPM
jgi:hypothetical protein